VDQGLTRGGWREHERRRGATLDPVGAITYCAHGGSGDEHCVQLCIPKFDIQILLQKYKRIQGIYTIEILIKNLIEP